MTLGGKLGALALGGMLVAGAAWADQPPLESEVRPGAETGDSHAPWDPLQGFNRKMFWFNEKVDQWVLTPAATGLTYVAPEPVRRSISRFFDNTQLPLVVLHDLLQGKPKTAASDLGRFLTNTTIGLVGFLDPASVWGLEDHDEDFGQTLAVWGVPAGPYLVVPFWGPTNFRDGTGSLVDNAWVWFTPGYWVTIGRVVWAVNDRSLVLREVDEARKASLDFYAAVRDAYGQRRRRLITDATDTRVQDETDLYFPGVDE
ncbi:MAG TPA: VacJ family lipoprotein [Candidatus Limnocylindria bacterium]|nr:VacJ family lipoprotein [Candidatus Limnocylindria bacterium]